MPKRDEAFMEQQRERIIDAATRCFLSKGFRDTSIRDICEEASLSVGAIYVHFENRDELATAVTDRATSQTIDATIDVLSLDDFIRTITQLIIECHENPSMNELNHQMIADAFSTEHMAEVYKERMTTNAAWMRAHVKRFHDEGKIDMPFDLDTTTRGLLSFLTGFNFRMYFEPSRPDKVVAKQMHSIVSHLIGVPKVAVAKRTRKRKAG